MLSVAGVLDTRMGGPGFKLYRYLQDNVATYIPLEQPGPETYRRTVYHHNARASRVDLISEFDGPDCAFIAPKRSATTSPLQALTLLNHRFTLDMSQALAQRLRKEAGPDDRAAQVDRAHLLAWGRHVSSSERAASVEFIRQYGLPAFCRALLNANETIHVD
jgi:hypothetical protein